jgi:DNA-binding XRE family transcriptional regulator
MTSPPHGPLVLCYAEILEEATMVDVFRVPMDVTYALAGGEPALLAYRRWRNISRDDLAAKSGVPKQDIEAIEEGNKDIEEEMLESLSTILKVPQDQLI